MENRWAKYEKALNVFYDTILERNFKVRVQLLYSRVKIFFPYFVLLMTIETNGRDDQSSIL